MVPGLKKETLVKLAQLKSDDAKLLFDKGRYSNAYYLGGYAIEFAIKACIAGRIEGNTIPDKRFINAIYVHSFQELINVAGLQKELRLKQDESSSFHANWGIVSEWTPEIRYEVMDRSRTQFFLHAISDEKNGVFQWIRSYW